MVEYSGSTWKVDYGEITDRNQFRVGYIGSTSWEAYFPVGQLADLVAVLTGVEALGVGVLQKGTDLQARKVSDGFHTKIRVEPRSDTFPPEIMRYYASTNADLIDVLESLQADVEATPEDWDFSKPSPIPPELIPGLETIVADLLPQMQSALEDLLAETDIPEIVRDTMGAALVAGVNITIEPNDGGDTITISASGGGEGAVDWGDIGGTMSNQTDLQAELDSKANATHVHAQSDVTGLTTALSGKADSSHTHAQSDVTGLTTALSGKADSSHTHSQSDVTGLTTALSGKQDSDADLTAIAGLSPANNDILQRKSGAWTNRTPAQVKTDLALTKSDVGLSNVDNTADASKSFTGAQVAAATDSARGTVELSTPAEAVAGTDTTRAVTPAGLAAKIIVDPVDESTYPNGTIFLYTE